MATIDDFGGPGQALDNPPLGGPSGWAKAVRDAIRELEDGLPMLAFEAVALDPGTQQPTIDQVTVGGVTTVTIGIPATMLGDDSVETIALKDGAVTSAKIADGTIVDADINASAAISRSKISGLPTSSVDNTLPKFDSTAGALQASGVVVDDNDRLRVASGSSGGLEIGSSGVLNMSGTGGPSGISAPVGSTWRQTDANATYGSLAGLLWNKVGTGTAEGTDWLVDYEGRWVTYTATWTNVSMSSTTARYTRRGKFVTFSCVGTLSSAPSGAVTVTTPTDMGSDMAHGPVRLVRSGGSWQGVWFYTSASSVLVRYLDDANTWQNLSSTLPASWASGDKIALNGTYEIA